MIGKRWLVGATALALVLGAAGCGRSGSGSSTSGGGGSTTTAGTAAKGDFGDLKGVCGPGNAKGATTQGVTDSEIRVATFSDVGFQGRIGLNQELFDVADVFTAWCNDAGGINGRKIRLDKRDAKLTEDDARMIESCRDDFAIVGGGAVYDNFGEKSRLKCLLPAIPGYVVSAETREADLQVQPVPNGLYSIADGDVRWLQKTFPDASDHVGFLTGAGQASLIIVDQQYQEIAQKLGMKKVYADKYPLLGDVPWPIYVQALKSAGVKGIYWTGEPENLAHFLVALDSVGYKLDYIRTEANHYDQSLLKLAGSSVKNVYVRSIFYPFETASKNPATQQYIDLFKKYKPKGKWRAYLGLQSFSAWLLFAEAAKKCDSDLTRKCLLDSAKGIHSWTGGGLHAETDPGAAKGSTCFTEFAATPTGFKLAPIGANQGVYRCDPENLLTLTGDYGKSLTLADVGKSLADLK